MIKGEALNTAAEKLWDDLRDPEKTIFAQAQISTGRSRSGLSDAQLRQAGADAGRLWKWYHLNEGLNGMAEPVAPLEAPLHLLSQARDLYLRLHEKGTDGMHVQRTNNLIAKVIAACGDKDLTAYTRADARKFSETLAAEGLMTTTIRSYLSNIVAVINRGTKEWQITMTNPFSGIDIKAEGKDKKKIEPFTDDELAAIVTACGTSYNQISHVAAIQAATGARIKEVTRYRVEDLELDDEIPHILVPASRSFKPHAEDRMSVKGLYHWSGSAYGAVGVP